MGSRCRSMVWDIAQHKVSRLFLPNKQQWHPRHSQHYSIVGIGRSIFHTIQRLGAVPKGRDRGIYDVRGRAA